MKLLFTALLLLFCSLAYTQNTSLVFRSDSANFFVFLDEVEQSTVPTNYLRINNCNFTKTNAKISFADNNEASFITSIQFDSGGETHYLIKKKEGSYELVLERRLDIDAKLPIKAGQIEINYTDTSGNEHFPPVKETGYTGNKGCAKPISLGEVKLIYESMIKSHYPDEKYKIASKSLKGSCATTDQILKLSGALRNEAYEEKFAIFCYDIAYDLDNYSKVIDALSEISATNVKAKLGL